nr:Ig-like domain-containing protein [Kineosporia rhizophila]
MRAPRTLRTDQRGFTLIEVMVALVLMSLILMSGGMFMMRAMYTSSSLGTRDSATTVANQVLEEVRAMDPTFDGDDVIPLVYGRTKSAVVAQWGTAASAGVDVSQTYVGSGSTDYDNATYDAGTHAVSIPLEQKRTYGNRDYTVSMLIGACARADTGGACTKGTTGSLLLRVVALVRWKSPLDQCPATGCTYAAATLIDPAKDPQFNSSRRPVANADSASTTAGTSVDIPVTFNDSGVFALYGAVSLMSTPANGTVSVYSTNNIVKYTPKSGFAGIDTFTYRVVDTSNRVSDVAVVTVVVSPLSVPVPLPTSIGGLLGAAP